MDVSVQQPGSWRRRSALILVMVVLLSDVGVGLASSEEALVPDLTVTCEAGECVIRITTGRAPSPASSKYR